MSARILYSEVIIPGFLRGVDYCIFRVNRSFDGSFDGRGKAHSYICGTRRSDNTSLFPATITWRISGGFACDESNSIWPVSKLIAEGITIVRNDGFAHFMGNFQIIKETPGQPDITYFEGTMELIGRSGSHQQLGEQCNQDNHIEGWLIGQGGKPVPEYTLRAVIVAKGPLSSGVWPFADTTVDRITGTLMKAL
jgi:hypothetical protein